MSEETSDPWFYTAGGERIGPVTFPELRVLAETGELNPRSDLCWTSGMADWLPTGEIEGLFEKKRNFEAKDTLNDAQNLSRNPQTLDKLSERELELKLLEAQWPGVNRRAYLATVFIMPLVLTLAVSALGHFFLNLENEKDMETLLLVSGVTSLIIIGFVGYMSLERFRNVGMSRWWFLGNLIPILNLWTGYRSFCCPAGYEFHRKMDGKGKFLRLLYWGLVGLSSIILILGGFRVLSEGPESLNERIERLIDHVEKQEEDPANVAPPSEP